MIVSVEEFGEKSLSRAEELLAGFPGAMDKVLKGAINQTTRHLRSNVSKRIRERYAISSSDLRTEQNASASYRYTPGVGMEASVKFSGKKIPLYRFDGTTPKVPSYSSELVNAMIQGNWRKVHPGIAASGHQLKGTAPVKFNHAFVTQFKSGHIGIFERTGGVTADGSDEIKEIMGSSIPQMLGNEEVAAKLANDAKAKFDECMAHEIDAILNGWR